MKHRMTTLLAATATAALLGAGAAAADPTTTAPAPPAPPPASPAPYPAMSATLSANPHPAVFDAGPLGNITVTGVLSGGGFYQSNPIPQVTANGNFDDRPDTAYGDITNGLVMVQKTDGPVQFFAAAGVYSFAALGAAYYPAVIPVDHDHDQFTDGYITQTQNSFGYLPEAFLKIVPNANWSIQAGILPTVVGDEYAFSFENMNIQRGLLWNQENIFDKGVQVNYTNGPWAVSASINDGFDSGVFNTASGMLTYTFKNSDTLEFAGSGAWSEVKAQSNQFLVPVLLSNSAIYNLIYTHTQGPWTISPYFQYTSVPKNNTTGGSGSTVGGAVLVKYSITPEFSIAARGEYISSSGAAILLYGHDSNAYSITVTPTYQKGILFVRGELSYTGIGSGKTGFEFGDNFNEGNQVRVAGEAGVIF